MRTLSIRLRVACALACAWLLMGSQNAAAISQRPEDIDRAAAVRTFTERIGRYATLRARLEEPLPSFDARRDPWSLLLTRRYLGSAIRAARSRAQQGDIFTPQVAFMFREVIMEAVYDVDVEGLVDGDLEAADFMVDLVVNEMVPAWAMEEVPRALLDRLPVLPDAVVYRIVSGALILWDVHAEILIAALPGAFQPQSDAPSAQ